MGQDLPLGQLYNVHFWMKHHNQTKQIFHYIVLMKLTKFNYGFWFLWLVCIILIFNSVLLEENKEIIVDLKILLKNYNVIA